jgi:hypothetical protein
VLAQYGHVVALFYLESGVLEVLNFQCGGNVACTTISTTRNELTTATTFTTWSVI